MALAVRGVSEDRNNYGDNDLAALTSVALAVRGERGSQLQDQAVLARGPVEWRSPFAVSKDRNTADGSLVPATRPGGARRSR